MQRCRLPAHSDRRAVGDDGHQSGDVTLTEDDAAWCRLGVAGAGPALVGEGMDRLHRRVLVVK